MRHDIPVDEKLLEAFHLMFDHYPEPATLVHKTKVVVAVNPACCLNGREAGMVCAHHGPTDVHKGCLAAKALKEHAAKWKLSRGLKPWGQEAIAFWLPVDGYPDFFVHFGIGDMGDPMLCEETGERIGA